MSSSPRSDAGVRATVGHNQGMTGGVTFRSDSFAGHRPSRRGWIGLQLSVVAMLSLVLAACSSSPEGGTVPVDSLPPVEDRIVSEPRPGFPEVMVEVTNNRFEPGTIEVRLGEIVNIVVVNEDSESHDFYIDAPGIHTHPNHPVYIPVDAGQSASGELHAEAAGDFEIVCTLPGHAQRGHTAVLRVSG